MMRFANAQFAKVLRRTLFQVRRCPGPDPFFEIARTGDDANTIPVRLIVLNSAGDAQAVLDRLKAGDDFAVLAREQSVDPTVTDGGFLGKIDPASLRGELRDALRGVQPGQLSKIVRIPSGYAVMKVLTDTETADLAEGTAPVRPPSGGSEHQAGPDSGRTGRGHVASVPAPSRRAGARTCMPSVMRTVSRRSSS